MLGAVGQQLAQQALGGAKQHMVAAAAGLMTDSFHAMRFADSGRSSDHQVLPLLHEVTAGQIAQGGRRQGFLVEVEIKLLKRLLQLQEEAGLTLITPEELLLIQQMWKAARDPDDGRGVARIVNKQRGIIMSADLRELNRLRELEEEVASEKNINPDILRRMLAKVEEYSESHRAHGLPDDLLNILKDDLAEHESLAAIEN